MSDSKSNQKWKCPREKYWKQRSVKSWDELVRIENRYFADQKGKKFIFRGQGFYGNLKTSLERAFEEFKINGKHRIECEKQLIRSFQRKAAYYLKGIGVPPLNNTLEWLSRMQHHGAPTRLLDWTYSFYRSLYNAVSKETEKAESRRQYKCELWVMDTKWFTRKTEGRSKPPIEGKLRESIEEMPEENPRKSVLLEALNASDKEREDYKGDLANDRSKLVQYLMDLEEPLPLVYNVTPIGLNERMIYQQGTFVLPGDITKCFMQNFEPYRGDNCQEYLYRIVVRLEQQERNRIIERLNDMNINEAVLFPGIDGFARSLRLNLAFYHKR